MRKLFSTRKRIAIVAAVAVVALSGVAAFAYFVSSGSGTGTASVGTDSNIQLSSTLVGNLYPGGADVPVNVSVHNPGSGNEYVSDISGTVADNGACLGTWFQVDIIHFDFDVTHGDTVTAGPTNVRMLDSGTDQNICRGKTMTINWSSD